jgi:uncharacterized protein involved in exopolysaccharide biosynthesis
MLSDNEQQNDTVLLTNFIRKNFRLLILITAAGGVLGLLVTFFIPKQYKSTGIVFPPSTPALESSIENPNFGFDIEADRLIQILQSNAMRDSVAGKFDLLKYYDLDADDPERMDKFIKKFKKDIQFERSSSMSILITARTREPELSSKIVNYIIKTADAVREKIYKQNILVSYEHAKEEYKQQKKQTDSVQEYLLMTLKANHLNSLILLASNSQISIDMDKLSEAQKNNNISSDLGSNIIAFKNMNERLRESESRLIRIRKILETPIPGLFVIDYAQPSYTRVSPSFLMNTLVSGLFALCAALVILLFRNSIGNRSGS